MIGLMEDEEDEEEGEEYDEDQEEDDEEEQSTTAHQGHTHGGQACSGHGHAHGFFGL
ncbi:hypothetical protein T484DRAFT_1775826 [Baffinella frigidus]|nr:hypothetical protein T484DRAFT_1775826 [Cryptophyta sp. CCMP2293]